MSQTKTLVLLGTGGTIAGQSHDRGLPMSYQCAELGVEELLHGLTLPAGMRLEAEQVAQIDSKDVGADIWRALLQRVDHHLRREDVAGVVVTHGTDTLEETAYLLQAVLAPAKPVVLVSAMRPANALSPDGPQNLQDGLCLAADSNAQGVLTVCAGQVYGAWEVQKMHPTRVDAFGAGQGGAYAEVLGGRVRWWRRCEPGTEGLSAEKKQRLLCGEAWPRVEWLNSHGGSSGALVRALLQNAAEGDPPVRGILVAGTGNGTLHADLADALRVAQQAGVRVWRTTRCPMGCVRSTGPEDEFAICALPAPKARLALLLDVL